MEGIAFVSMKRTNSSVLNVKRLQSDFEIKFTSTTSAVACDFVPTCVGVVVVVVGVGAVVTEYCGLIEPVDVGIESAEIFELIEAFLHAVNGLCCKIYE